MVLGIILALLSGVCRTVGRMLNARLSEEIGPLQSAFFNYIVGFACALPFMILRGDGSPAARLADLPAWTWLGGAVGVAFVVLANLVTPRLSAYRATLLIFIGQIAAGVAIEAAIRGTLEPLKAVGGILILAGLLADRPRLTAASSRPRGRRDRS
jgi:transporter family-2 protein